MLRIKIFLMIHQIKILLQYLNAKDLECINDIKKRLMNYNEYMMLFEKDFESLLKKRKGKAVRLRLNPEIA